MDFLKGNTGTGSSGNTTQKDTTKGGLMDKFNNMAGGGAQGEKNEDALDKAVDYVQEHMLGQGQQSDESALEQAKDEQIASAIRGQYEKFGGK